MAAKRRRPKQPPPKPRRPAIGNGILLTCPTCHQRRARANWAAFTWQCRQCGATGPIRRYPGPAAGRNAGGYYAAPNTKNAATEHQLGLPPQHHCPHCSLQWDTHTSTTCPDCGQPGQPVHRKEPMPTPWKGHPVPENPRNFCRTCGQDFTSLRNFDRHRTGRYDVPEFPKHEDGRRCLDTDELRDAGLEKDTHGRWHNPTHTADVARRFKKAPPR